MSTELDTPFALQNQGHSQGKADADSPTASLMLALRKAVESHADSKCLDYFGNRLTYRQVWKRAESLATYLQRAGIGDRDRIMIALPNIPETVVAIMATFMCNGVAVMVNPLCSESEHAFQLKDSGAQIVITLDVLASRFETISTSIKPAPRIIAASLGGSLPPFKRWAARLLRKLPTLKVANSPHVVPFAAAVAHGNGSPPPISLQPSSALAALLYTGGTTGTPKAVALSWSNLAANVDQISNWLDMLPDGMTNVLAVFPFFTGAGLTALLLQTLARGNQLVLLPRPDASSITAALRRVPIHVFPGVPTIYRLLLADAQFVRHGCRLMAQAKLCVSGAAPLDGSTFDAWLHLTGMPIHELYGMTETTAMAFGNRPGMSIKRGSVGCALPGLHCLIVSTHDSQPMPRGEIGEVWLRGPQIATGYYRNEQETAVAFHGEWLRTGDLGHLDTDGYLFLSGRKKEMIISSGYNVYPKEVEETLLQHEAVAECACVGVPDARRGEALHAYVVIKHGHTLSGQTLRELCKVHLAIYKIPQEFSFVEALPKNALGKVQKALIRPPSLPQPGSR